MKYSTTIMSERPSEMGNRYCGFAFVEANSARYSRATRLPYVGLWWQATGPHHDPGFPLPLFWPAETIDQRAMRRVFQQ
jgi:hypothetical protein